MLHAKYSHIQIPARLLLDSTVVIIFHRWENSSISQLVNEEVGVQASKPGCFISHSSLGFVTVQACHQEDFLETAKYREQTGPGLIFRKVKVLVTQSCQLFTTPWTVAHQVLLSMGFSRQPHWRGLPFLSPGYLPDLGIVLRSPTLQQILYHLSHHERPTWISFPLSILIHLERDRERNLLVNLGHMFIPVMGRHGHVIGSFMNRKESLLRKRNAFIRRRWPGMLCRQNLKMHTLSLELVSVRASLIA